MGKLLDIFIIFLILKLVHVIAWSWWWVTSPVWIPVAILLVLLIAEIISVSNKHCYCGSGIPMRKCHNDQIFSRAKKNLSPITCLILGINLAKENI